MILPKCLNCGTKLELDDVSDVTYYEDRIKLFCVGYCPKCNKDYQWDKIGIVRPWTIENLKEI